MIFCLMYVISCSAMGRNSSTNFDQERARLYSAYNYIGNFKFQKSSCVNRGKKTGKCYEWKVEVLDLNKVEDSEFVKSSMILIGESEI